MLSDYYVPENSNQNHNGNIVCLFVFLWEEEAVWKLLKKNSEIHLEEKQVKIIKEEIQNNFFLIKSIMYNTYYTKKN